MDGSLSATPISTRSTGERSFLGVVRRGKRHLAPVARAMFWTLGLITLLLAALGIHGVIAFNTSPRIYGPEYTRPENLDRLRARGLNAKRSLALRECALGIEGLERFVRREPLRRVHECAFGVLALESEPVDPRL
jgi:hypothetical protein